MITPAARAATKPDYRRRPVGRHLAERAGKLDKAHISVSVLLRFA
jgi:hypothetical protein